MRQKNLISYLLRVVLAHEVEENHLNLFRSLSIEKDVYNDLSKNFFKNYKNLEINDYKNISGTENYELFIGRLRRNYFSANKRSYSQEDLVLQLFKNHNILAKKILFKDYDPEFRLQDLFNDLEVSFPRSFDFKSISDFEKIYKSFLKIKKNKKTNFNFYYLLERTLRFILIAKKSKLIAEKILNISKPNRVFLNLYGSPEIMGFVHACNLNKIPTVEIPNGMVGVVTWQYNHMLLKKYSFSEFPSHIWCWDNNMVEDIKIKNNVNNFERINLGHPRFILYRPTTRDINDKKIKILITQQYVSTFPNLSVELINHLKGNSNFQVDLKLHPQSRFKAAIYENFFENDMGVRINVINPTYKEYLEIIDYYDCVISDFSTTLLEAKMFGKIAVSTSNHSMANMFLANYTTGENKIHIFKEK